VEIVDITDAANQTVTVTFDRTSKLPMRQIFRRRNPQFKDFDTEVSIFANYRDAGHGVQWPCNIRRERNGDKIFEMYSESVEIDKNVADDLFTVPAKMKILPKPKSGAAARVRGGQGIRPTFGFRHAKCRKRPWEIRAVYQ
jgi:hypothetical protein